MKNSLYVLPAVLLLFSSCSMMKESTTTTLDIQSGVYQYPTVADMDVTAKAEKTVKWNFVPFQFKDPSLDKLALNTVAELLKEKDCDVLLEPQYIYTKVPYGERTLTILGFPAKYKNFRKATTEDIKAIQSVSNTDITKVKVVNVTPPKQVKKKHHKKLLLSDKTF